MDFSKVGEVKIDMINYIKFVLNNIPSEVLREATSLVANNLFNIEQDNLKSLNKEQRKLFVHVIM